MLQAKHLGESFTAGTDKMIHNQNVNVPPATHFIRDLEPHSLYAVRVACHSSQGPSDWSPWVELRTKEGGKSRPSEEMFVFTLDLLCECGLCVCGITSSEANQGQGCVIRLLTEVQVSSLIPAVHYNRHRADVTH